MDARVRSFIADTFSSVWDLELMLLLKAHPERTFKAAELVSQLRASESVIAKGSASLVAAGLAIDEADGALRYGPATPDLEALVSETEAIYRAKPDAIRRLIAQRSAGSLGAFADAFKLWGGGK